MPGQPRAAQSTTTHFHNRACCPETTEWDTKLIYANLHAIYIFCFLQTPHVCCEQIHPDCMRPSTRVRTELTRASRGAPCCFPAGHQQPQHPPAGDCHHHSQVRRDSPVPRSGCTPAACHRPRSKWPRGTAASRHPRASIWPPTRPAARAICTTGARAHTPCSNLHHGHPRQPGHVGALLPTATGPLRRRERVRRTCPRWGPAEAICVHPNPN